MHFADRLEQPVQRHFFHHKSTGTCHERLIRLITARVIAEHHHTDIAKFLAQQSNRFQSVDAGHPQVKQHHIRTVDAKRFNGIEAVVRVSHHLHVRLATRRGHQPHTKHDVIVDQENSDLLRRRMGQ
jgi:hypothetical protein